MTGIREQALLLGRRNSLVGIVAQSAAAPLKDLGIVILNSGIIHRVGPNRLFVRLARLLAAEGYLVMRFDLSGIGDSEARADGLAPLEAALADIREVLDSLEATRNVGRVILVGLCSGADHSVIYSAQDRRVAGMVLIDPSVPRTWGYYVRHYRGRLLKWQSWRNFALGRHPFWKAVRGSVGRRTAARIEDPELRPWTDVQVPQVRHLFENAYARTVAAGVRILGVFTGGRQAQHNHSRQLLEAFPRVAFGSQLRLEYMRSADHTFGSERDRSRLMQLVVEWIAAQPPSDNR